MAEGPIVTHDEARHRFELKMPDGQSAHLTYRLLDGGIALVHTEVPPASQHHGFGGMLAHAALEYARAQGLFVTPICPFVVSYLKDHPEFAPLVRT